MHAILEMLDDFDLRVHHRALMESAGLRRLLEICSDFCVPGIDDLLKKIQSLFSDDEKQLRERLDQGVLQDLTNPQDVFNAIHAKTQGTKASNYFLSMMQHLLLIREEGQPMVHYYQLLDSIVTDVVLDKKLPGAEQRMGYSVERIIAQFNEAGRYQKAEDEAAEARAVAVRLKLEKEALEDELSGGLDGLAGRLKAQITNLEERLTVSRETATRFQGQLESQRASYEEKIAQLEAQIVELFRMLKEVGKGMETVLDGAGSMDRKALVECLERTFQRHKTINKLEGKDFTYGSQRRRRRVKQENGLVEEDVDVDLDATPRKESVKRPREGKFLEKKPGLDDSGRVSQFMDADEADAREQVQQQIAAGVKLVGQKDDPISDYADCYPTAVFSSN